MNKQDDKYKLVFWSYTGLAIIFIYLVIKNNL
jgi:hypothetical protein